MFTGEASFERFSSELREGFLLHRRVAAYCDLLQVDTRFLHLPSTASPCLPAAASRTPVAGLQRLCDSRRIEALRGNRAPARGPQQPVAAASAPKRRATLQPVFSFGSLPSAHSTHRACRHLQPVAGVRIDFECHAVHPSGPVKSQPLRRVLRLHCAYLAVLLTPLAFLDFIFPSLTLIASGSPLQCT